MWYELLLSWATGMITMAALAIRALVIPIPRGPETALGMVLMALVATILMMAILVTVDLVTGPATTALGMAAPATTDPVTMVRAMMGPATT